MASTTIRDVAKQAGVSVATVSRVFNNSSTVSEQTRKKVLHVCNELDYHPHPYAQRLSLGRSLTVAVILPFLTIPSYVERLRGVQQILEESEYDLVLFTATSPEKRDAHFSELSRKGRVDGLLIVSLPPSDDQVKRFNKSNLPAVLIDAYHPEMNRVVSDDIRGGYLATKYLLDLGHRKIAYLSDKLDTPFHFVAMRQRFEGYCQALHEAGITVESDYHRQGRVGGVESYEKAKELLLLPDPPTAIFAASDTNAVGVIKAARDLDVKVPDDLSIIGYDGIRDSEYLEITTIQQPLFRSGVEGVELLFTLLEKPIENTQEIKLPVHLIVRETSAPPSRESYAFQI